MSKEITGAEIAMHLGNGKCSLNIALEVGQKQPKEEFCKEVRELMDDFMKSEAL